MAQCPSCQRTADYGWGMLTPGYFFRMLCSECEDRLVRTINGEPFSTKEFRLCVEKEGVPVWRESFYVFGHALLFHERKVNPYRLAKVYLGQVEVALWDIRWGWMGKGLNKPLWGPYEPRRD